MTAKGYFALVLHAHLPFVRHPEDPTVMEERWLYEAITGSSRGWSLTACLFAAPSRFPLR